MNQIGTYIIGVLLAAATTSCGTPVSRVEQQENGIAEAPAPWDLVEDGEDPPMTGYSDYDDYEYEDSTFMAADSVDRALPEVPEIPGDTMALDPTRRSRYNRIGSLREVFNDSNKYQYAVAERLGIRPIRSLTDAYYLSRPLVEISSCAWYDLDTLKHSMPYLVPESARLLETIGRNFADSLAKRGTSKHKFRVTSLLRTPHSVKKLRRVNRNATDSSTHQFATTFDISYAHFNHYGGPVMTDEELKYVLAEVLWDLRRQNKCMVKFERRTPCFHITATGR